jgi:hypothetical protein
MKKGRASLISMLVALLLGAGAAQAQPAPEPRARPYSGSSPAQQADFRALRKAYHEAFAALGLARRCGLEWQVLHDEFVATLERRHGRDMAGGEAGHFEGLVSIAMHNGAQGQFGKERGALNCSHAERYLAAARLPELPPSVVLAPGERIAPRPRRSRGPNDDLFVSPESAVAQAIYRQKVTADAAKLAFARETLRYAGDDEAVWAINRYLERLTLAQLLGEPLPIAADVASIVRDEPWRDTAGPRAQRAKLLATSLQPVLALSRGDECDRSPYSGMQPKCDYLGDSVWTGRDDWVYLRIQIENASGKDISQFDARLRIDLGEAKPAELDCATRADTRRGLASGLSWEYFCRETLEKLPAERLLQALKQVRADPGRWALAVTRINFAEPPVNVGPTRAMWLDTPEASAEVSKALRARSCLARGSCLADFQHRFDHNPMWPAATAGVVLGGASAALIAHFARRRVAAGLVASLVVFLGLVGSVVALFFGGAPFAAVFLAQLGLVGAVAFLATLWAALGAFGARR